MNFIKFNQKSLEITKGPFQATVESLQQYKCPDWYRDAKFGIWAHWGPQAVPSAGDWYARNMYIEGSKQYEHHLENYGHPSKFGYKDIVKLWKAEHFDPNALMKMYKKAGARYFMALGVHHDNFDCWDSKYHNWNSVKMGPCKDIVGMWREAALKEGLRFGVSEHHERSYSWFNTNKNCDKEGICAGIPYDGNDPAYEDFYYEPHADDNCAYPLNPSPHFVENWYLRIKDLVERYHPEIVYMDGGVPFGEVGLAMIANYYNSNINQRGGKLEAVHLFKDVNAIFPELYHGEFFEGIATEDFECGVTDKIMSEPWQSGTHIGDWMYNRNIEYKPTSHVIHQFIDIVSKNGNMLLTLPPKPDGTLDDYCMKFLAEMDNWITVNGEAIYSTRPWKSYGEGVVQSSSGAYKEQETKYTASDFRFTQKGDSVYAFWMEWPQDNRLIVKSFAADGQNDKVEFVRLLGYDGNLEWQQKQEGLHITLPNKKPCEFAWALEVR